MRDRRFVALATFLVACQGDPVGEISPDAATGGSAGTGIGGSAGIGIGGSSGASGGSSGAGGVAGSSGSGGSGGLPGCDGGVCAPIELVPSGEAARGVAVDQSFVYYTTSKAVWRVSKAGGAPQSLASGLTGVHQIAVDQNSVFFINSSTLQRVPKTGGSPAILAQESAGFDEYGDLATDGVHPYVTRNISPTTFDGIVFRVPVAGGSRENLAQLSGARPLGIALTDNNVVWGNGIGRTVQWMPKAGGTLTTVVSNILDLSDVAVSKTHYVWAQSSGVGIKPVSGGSNVYVPGESNTHSVALDATHAYWTTINFSTLSRVKLGETLAETVLANFGGPRALALDDTGIYFTNLGTSPFGAVYRLPK